MAERIVINTGPLIALDAAEALELVGELPCEFMCPRQVRDELDAGAASGWSVIAPSWLTVLPLSTPLNPVAEAVLDPGEAAVIQLALEQNVPIVGIDERKGRQTARAVGLQVVGSLGLLLRAKEEGLTEAVEPYLRLLQGSRVWFHPDLIQRVLRAAGE